MKRFGCMMVIAVRRASIDWETSEGNFLQLRESAH